MSTPEITPEQAVEELRFLTRDYLPQATWTVGGALRFDKSLLTINNFLSQMTEAQFNDLMEQAIAIQPEI